jgi:hypothetical protein
MAVSTHRPLGEILVAQGRIRHGSLLRELAAQAEDRLIDVFTWGSGKLWFLSGVRDLDNEVRGCVDVAALVTRGVREGYSDEEIAEWISPAKRLPVTRGLARRVDPVRLGLSLEERRALERAIKAPSIEALVAELANENVAQPADTLRGLFLGVSVGVLTLPGWPNR